MSRYLIVAHQTAGSEELVARVRKLAAEDPGAEFTLLVPATPVERLLTWTEGESIEIARRQGEKAKARLEAAGARVTSTAVGDASPLQAISDELRDRPGRYDALILSTLPPGISRWLKLDLLHQAERRFKLPLIHVTAREPVSAR